MEKRKEFVPGKVETERKAAKEFLRWYANVFREQKRDQVAGLIDFIEEGVNEGAALTNGQRKLFMEALGSESPDLNENNKAKKALTIATFINSCH